MSVPAEQMDPTAVQSTPEIPKAIMRLRELVEMDNIAEDLTDDELMKIGQRCVDEYKTDKDTRADWERDCEEGIKLAKQVTEEKDWPWAGAANVKFPLLSEAAITFSARAYPELVKNDVVKAEVVGKDPEGAKAARALRISTFSSWQIKYKMPYWDEETDSLLVQLPLVGNVFRKVYEDPLDGPQARLVRAQDFVVNHNVKSLELARRETEIMEFFGNDVQERMRSGEWRDIELSADQKDGSPDEDKPYVILEQHRWLDLDDDGYEEPYVVTVHESTQKVLRIVARFTADDVTFRRSTGKIVRIEPTRYYIKYGFIPNPDGGLYDIGLCHLLLPVSESINTVINQLLDAGTLSNTQGGLIAKGIRIKGGKMAFSPGEWKFTDTMGQDLRDSVFPLPVREPSSVLFQLLGLLIDSGRSLANLKDVLQGELPQGDMPATTVLALIEQGQKVYSGIYKRIYRAMGTEFKAVFRLNKKAMKKPQFMQMYKQVLDDQQATPDDFNDVDYDVCPVADPTVSSQAQRIARAQVLLPTKDEPGAKVGAIITEYLLSAGFDTPERYYDPEAAQQAANEQQQKQAQMADLMFKAELAIKNADAMLKDAEGQYKRIQTQQIITEMQKGPNNSHSIKAESDVRKAEIEGSVDLQKAQIHEAAENDRAMAKLRVDERIAQYEGQLQALESQQQSAIDLFDQIKTLAETMKGEQENPTKALTEGLKAVIEGQTEVMKSLTKPKRIIRGDNGRMEGVE